MGCDWDRISDNTRGMFHYLTKRPLLYHYNLYGKQWPRRSRLFRIARVNNISPRTSFVLNKMLQTKDSANMCTNNVILRRWYKQHIQWRRWDFMENKPLHDSGRHQCAIREKNEPHGNGKIWARMEKEVNLGRQHHITMSTWRQSSVTYWNFCGDTFVEWATSHYNVHVAAIKRVTY